MRRFAVGASMDVSGSIFRFFSGLPFALLVGISVAMNVDFGCVETQSRTKRRIEEDCDAF